MNATGILVRAALLGIAGYAAYGDDVEGVDPTRQAVTATAEVNGTTIYYKISGHDAHRPPVLFLHGLGLDSGMWDPQIAIVSNFRKTLQVDLRGHGRSGGVFGPTALHWDVLALLDCLHIDQIDVVGHSLGGGIALDLLLAQPERVRSLTLIDSDLGGYPYDFNDPNGFALRLFGYVNLANTVSLRAGLEAWLNDPLFATSRQNPEILAALQTMILGNEQQGDGSGFRNFALIARNFQQADQLSQIKSPTLVLVGEHDGAEFKDIARVLANSIPDAKSYVIPKADHMSNMVQADIVTSQLIRFWAKLARSQ